MKTKKMYFIPALLGTLLIATSCTVVLGKDNTKKTYADGVFTLRLENDNTSLSMDVQSTFDSPTLYIEETNIKSFVPFSYSFFNEPNTNQTFGNIHSEYTSGISLGKNEGGIVWHNLNFYKFTFFLMNASEETNNYFLDVKIKDPKNIGYDEYLRVMVFEGQDKQTVYAKKTNSESDIENEKIYQDKSSDLAEVFSDKEDIINISSSLDGKETRKITLLFWLEGTDPDCNSVPDDVCINAEVNIKGYK